MLKAHNSLWTFALQNPTMGLHITWRVCICSLLQRCQGTKMYFFQSPSKPSIRVQPRSNLIPVNNNCNNHINTYMMKFRYIQNVHLFLYVCFINFITILHLLCKGVSVAVLILKKMVNFALSSMSTGSCLINGSMWMELTIPMMTLP